MNDEEISQHILIWSWLVLPIGQGSIHGNYWHEYMMFVHHFAFGYFIWRIIRKDDLSSCIGMAASSVTISLMKQEKERNQKSNFQIQIVCTGRKLPPIRQKQQQLQEKTLYMWNITLFDLTRHWNRPSIFVVYTVKNDPIDLTDSRWFCV